MDDETIPRRQQLPMHTLHSFNSALHAIGSRTFGLYKISHRNPLHQTLSKNSIDWASENKKDTRF